MRTQPKAPRLGHLATVRAYDGRGTMRENYRFSLKDEYGKKRNLLLTPGMFFEATRLFSREIKGNPEAA